MGKKFKPKGPPRYAHQRRGLIKTIETGGVCALLFDPGCISGDTLVKINRAGVTRTMALRDLEFKFNGGVSRSRSWAPSIPTMIQRAEGGVVRLVPVVRVAESGIKPLYKLLLEDGRSIRATSDHPFLTPEGSTPLEKLVPGNLVLVNGGRSKAGRLIKQRYRERAGLRHHPFAYKRDARTSPYRVAEHRLVVEADMNGLSLSDYVNRLREGELEGLTFLQVKEHVHHLDFNPVNNDRSNLQVLSPSEHHRLHAEMGKGKHVLEQVVPARVTSITADAEEMTYDVTVASEPHNFIADGFALQNTGKTAVALDYMSLLALKAEPDEAGVREVRVLVTAPLAAVDTWVMQSEQYVSEDINVWAEALGGSIRQRAEALAARGGRPFKKESRTRAKHGPHGIHYEKSLMIRKRTDEPFAHDADGPASLGIQKPRLIIQIINLDTFSSRQQVGKSSSTVADVLLDAIKRFNPELVLVDESHKIKSATSNVSRMLSRVGRNASRRMILTGTVMPAGPLDVFGQWRFLNPYAFGEIQPDGEHKTATFDGFRRKFAEMGGYLGHQVVGYKNLDEMQKIMALNAEVARKEDALDLPPALPAIVPVTPSKVEAKAYDEMKKGLAVQLASGLHAASSNRLSQTMRLRQITSGFIPDDVGTMNVLGDSKAKVIESLVHDTLAGEKRIVVFVLFLYEIEMLRKKLAKEGTELMVISGATKPEERQRLRMRFGSDNPARIVMVAQVRTMSLAVNELVTASHAIFGSLSQQRDDLIQAQDRLNRIGQTRPVTFWYCLVPGTIDEVIYNAHQTRTNLETAVLRHIFDADEATSLESVIARRSEDEQSEQAGRLNDDGVGGIERIYGDASEIVQAAPTPEEGTNV